MKSGANINDVNRIKELYDGGFTAEEISQRMQIVLSCVESFEPEDVEDEEEDLDLGE